MGVIVVATDGSDAASAALDEAIALAGATGDTIAAITVWRALQGDFGLERPTTVRFGTLLEAERRHADHTLEEAERRGRDAGVSVEARLATGDPAERICTFAAERRARMIVMGSHGYGPVRSLLVGSVSGAVIREATCPVLVVPEGSARERRPRKARSPRRTRGPGKPGETPGATALTTTTPTNGAA